MCSTLNIIRVITFILFDGLFLQPFKFIATLFFRCAWFPKFKIGEYGHEDEPYEIPTPDDQTLEQTLIDDITAANLITLSGYKYISIITANLLRKGTDHNEPALTIYLDTLLSFLGDTGLCSGWPIFDSYTTKYGINLKPYMTAHLRINKEQICGLLYLCQVIIGMPNKTPQLLLLLQRVTNIFNVSITGTPDSTEAYKKRPFTLICQKPNGMVAESVWSIYDLRGLGKDMIRLVAWLKLGSILSPTKLNRFLYHLAKFIYAPTIAISGIDTNFFIGKYMHVDWSGIHTDAYICCSYLLLHSANPDSSLAVRLDKYISRHRYNLGLLALRSDKAIYPNTKHGHDLRPTAESYRQQATTLGYRLLKYFDLRTGDLQMLSAVTLDPLGTPRKYIVERNPILSVGNPGLQCSLGYNTILTHMRNSPLQHKTP